MQAQMKFQKIATAFAFASAIMFFLFALGFCTDISALSNNVKGYGKVAGSSIIYDVQPFNHEALFMSIVLIVLVVVMYIMQNAKRRKYYITNYLSSLAFSGYVVWTSIYVSMWSKYYKNQFLTTVDFVKWKKLDEKNTYSVYTESTFWFDFGTVVAVVGFVAMAIIVANLIWKTIWMIEEKKAMKLLGEEAKHEN